jgi:hypothetical protein
MVRATLRELTFIWDKRNQDQVLDIIVKEFKPSSRQMADETLNQFMRVITKDAFVSLNPSKLLSIWSAKVPM